jgi:F420-non-reducing hydrogenase large subunit
VESWSYLKFPVLRNVGWKGLVDGPQSGIYKATPLSRLNVSNGMATPLANEEHDRLFKTLGGKPVHQTLATHWARLVELLFAAERWVELAADPEITGPDYRVVPARTPDEGVGVVEAPRGTLFHHYKTDKRGIVQEANLIVGTTNNNAAINLSVKKAAENLIRKGNVSEGLLNIVEMAFRAYDPCFGCATHAWPGQAAFHVRILDREGNIIRDLRR